MVFHPPSRAPIPDVRVWCQRLFVPGGQFESRLLRWGQVDLNSCTLTVGQSKTESGTGRLLPPMTGRLRSWVSGQAFFLNVNPITLFSRRNATGRPEMERRSYTRVTRQSRLDAGRRHGNRQKLAWVCHVDSTTLGTLVALACWRQVFPFRSWRRSWSGVLQQRYGCPGVTGTSDKAHKG